MQTPAAHVHMTALHDIVGSRVGNEISAVEHSILLLRGSTYDLSKHLLTTSVP